MRLYFLAVFSLFAAECMHFLSLRGLYHTYPQFDIIPHFFSGIGIGLFLVQTIRWHWKGFTKFHEFVVVGCSFGIAVIWEVLEAAANVTGYVLFSTQYYVDTLKDICVGTVGGIIAIFIAREILRHIHSRSLNTLAQSPIVEPWREYKS